jgi:hypothetical protein
MTVEQEKQAIIKEMAMTRIAIDAVTLVDGKLTKKEFRTSQQWKNK